MEEIHSKRRQRNRAADLLSHPGKVSSLGAGTLLKVDDEARKAGWFLSGKPRETVKLVLNAMACRGTEGDFVLRDKLSVDGMSGIAAKHVLALNIKAHDGLLCFLLETNGGRFHLRGISTESFDSVSELIAFYSSEMRATLGVTLNSKPMHYIQLLLYGDKSSPCTAGSTSIERTYQLAYNPALDDDATYELAQPQHIYDFSATKVAYNPACDDDATYELAQPQHIYDFSATKSGDCTYTFASSTDTDAPDNEEAAIYNVASGCGGRKEVGRTHRGRGVGKRPPSSALYDLANLRMSCAAECATYQLVSGDDLEAEDEGDYTTATATDVVTPSHPTPHPMKPLAPTPEEDEKCIPKNPGSPTPSTRSKRSLLSAFFARRRGKSESRKVGELVVPPALGHSCEQMSG